MAGVFWSALHTALPVVSSTAVFFLGAMFLAPEEFGMFSLAAGIVATAVALSPLGFGEALVQRRDLGPRHVNTVFMLTLGYGLLAAVALSLLAPAMARWTGEDGLAPLLWFLTLKLPLDVAIAAPSALIVRAMRFRVIAFRTALASAASAAVAIALLLGGFGVWALAAGQVTSSSVILAVTFRAARWRPDGLPSSEAASALFRYGAFASGGRMLSGLKADHVILGLLAGQGFLGLFVLAQRIQQMLTMILTGAWSSVTHVLLSSLQGDRAKTRTAFGLASFGSAAVGLPVFAGAALVVDDLIVLILPARWDGAAQAAQVFCLLGLLTAIGSVQGAFINSQGHADRWFYYMLAQQASTLAVLAIVHDAGLVVMIAAVAVKSYLLWPVSVVMTARLLGITVAEYVKDFIPPLAATAAMALAATAAGQVTADSSGAGRVAAQVAAGAATYVPVLLVLSRHRVAELRAVFARRGATS